MTVLFNSSSSPFRLSSLERLDISTMNTLDEDWDADTDIQVLELLRPFPAVKGLYTSTQPALHLARILQELAGERVAKVLPALENIFISEYNLSAAQEAMKPFLAARQLFGRPVTVNRWKRRPGTMTTVVYVLSLLHTTDTRCYLFSLAAYCCRFTCFPRYSFISYSIYSPCHELIMLYYL